MRLSDIGKSKASLPIGIAPLRLLLSGIVMAHGWARVLSGAVAPFGEFLDGQGFPFGSAIAWAITFFEISGSIVFALGRFVPHIACGFSLIYAVGIILVHASVGWFVVGLGRNGMEYSVLLIASLLLVGVNHMSVEVRARFGLFTKDTDN